MTDVATLIQFLYEGDFLGFLQAVYVSAFQKPDVFYGMLVLLFTSPLYIRTRSLLLLAILWSLLGTLFIVSMPMIAGLGVFLWIMAVGPLLWKLYVTFRG